MIDSKKNIELGNHYSCKDDFASAKNYYDQAAQINNDNSIVKLGQKQDYVKAKEYYEKSDDESIYNLANHYLNGIGVEKDISKAIQLFELSALKNNSLAYLNLGFIYLKNDGVEQDLAKAFLYFQASARLGNESAKEMINNFCIIFNMLNL